MITVKPKHIIESIQEQNFKVVRIYEGIVKTTDGSHFAKFKCESPEELENRVEKFFKTYQGRFTFFLRRSDSGTDASLTRNVVENLSVSTSSTPQATTLDRESIKQEILLEMQSEMKLKSLEQQVALKNAELEELHTNGGKLALVAVKLIQSFGLIKTAPVLNGTQQNTMNGQNTLNAQTKEQATDKLIQLFGEEGFIILVQKLENNPSHVQMVKTFLNT